MANCIWTGKSGTKYTYTVYEIMSTTWNNASGNYIFSKKNADGYWVALYIGECDSFKERLTPSHHKWDCAVRREGATHIHARTNEAGVVARRREESDLLGSYRTPCND